jgi:hypothetical protein
VQRARGLCALQSSSYYDVIPLLMSAVRFAHVGSRPRQRQLCVTTRKVGVALNERGLEVKSSKLIAIVSGAIYNWEEVVRK